MELCGNQFNEDRKHHDSVLRFALFIGCLILLGLGITSKAYAAVQVSVSPTSTITISGATTTFMATVMNASNTAVSWSANLGTISSSGIYAAPSVLGTSTLTDTITARSVQDNTKSATATVTVSSGLVGYYPLDEGLGTIAYDSSGNNATGSWQGIPAGANGTYYTPSAIVGSYAGDFDGSSDYVNTSNQSAATYPFSMCGWMNPAALDGVAIGNLSPLGYVGYDWDGWYISAGADWIYPTTADWAFGTANNNTFTNSTGIAVTLNQWQFVCGVAASLTNKLVYVNGVAGTVDSSSNTPSIPGDEIALGASVRGLGTLTSYFTGAIDDVRVYDRALSGSEIQTLYNSALGVPTAPTAVSASPDYDAATVSFGTPISNGGSLINLYTITGSPGDIIATTTAPTSTVISGLTNGVTYTFTVTATNNVGTSSSSPPVTVTPGVNVATVNWNTVDQVIDGFGASSAFESTPLTQSQADLFFSTSTGVGLSLLRTIVPTDGSCSSINGTCAGEISDMQMAAARGARVWSTSWSPPASMTTNNSTDCWDSPSPSHLATSSYAAYANYFSNYISSVEDAGVPLYALSIDNEPTYCTYYPSTLWSDQNFHDFIKNNLGPTLVANNQTSTKIMMPETGSWSEFTSLADTTMNDPSASTYVGILAFHGYDNSFSISNPYASSGKSFWETEVSGVMSGTPSLTLCNDCFDPSMADALLWAQVINYNLTGANENAWNYWWLINQNNDNEGLVYNGVVSKRLYMMGNYSKFVRPGWYRIEVPVNPNAGVYMSAFKDPATNNFAIVAINTNSTDTPLTISLNGVSANSVTPWITSANFNLAEQASIPASGNSFTPTLAAQSVTTFVGMQAPTSTPPTPITVAVAAGYAATPITSSPTTTTATLSTATSSSTSQVASSPSASFLQTELNTLLAKLASLESQVGTPAAHTTSSYAFTRSLSYGMTGVDVTALQIYLTAEDEGPAAQKLKTHGTTAYFGILTYNALVEFQRVVGITPASGFFGPLTRAWLNGH